MKAVVELLGSRGWRRLAVGSQFLVDHLAQTKCWGWSWSPEAYPDASLVVVFGG
jgi:hypothetical protein